MDTVSDMLARIRNAQAVKKDTVRIPYTNLNWNLAKVLEREGFLASIEKQGRKEKRYIEIELKYEDGNPRIEILEKISKPGRRVYIKKSEIFPKRGFLSIVSTPKGLMAEREAKKAGLGGELICRVGYTRNHVKSR
ncbi:MAG: 30S ribosomal protein S8 [Parcubacteria group bacterium]|nr:30S ribosomal protein S8 [Parcubacteria group bacterium]